MRLRSYCPYYILAESLTTSDYQLSDRYYWHHESMDLGGHVDAIEELWAYTTFYILFIKYKNMFYFGQTLPFLLTATT